MTIRNAKLDDEMARIAALHRYEILDTPREAAFDRITELVKNVFTVPICTISLIDTNRQWLKSCIGLDAQQVDREISFCTHTIKESTPLYIPDAKLDPRFAANPFVTGDPFIRTYLGVPLSTPDGYNVGSLCAIDVEPRTFSKQQIDVLKSFAAVVVNELELRRIAQTDHLTGALTRRGFTLELEKTLTRVKRSKQQSTLVILDVDHFKRVNDTYGHPAGDKVLSFLAAHLGSQLRQNDTLGRLGGEEFGIIMEGLPLRKALEATERLRISLERSSIDHDPPIRITASFGIAGIDRTVSSCQEAVSLADAALYDAKASGRNRCCVSPASVADKADRYIHTHRSNNDLGVAYAGH